MSYEKCKYGNTYCYGKCYCSLKKDSSSPTTPELSRPDTVFYGMDIEGGVYTGPTDLKMGSYVTHTPTPTSAPSFSNAQPTVLLSHSARSAYHVQPQYVQPQHVKPVESIVLKSTTQDNKDSNPFSFMGGSKTYLPLPESDSPIQFVSHGPDVFSEQSIAPLAPLSRTTHGFDFTCDYCGTGYFKPKRFHCYQWNFCSRDCMNKKCDAYRDEQTKLDEEYLKTKRHYQHFSGGYNPVN
jgi:hypothetical protein